MDALIQLNINDIITTCVTISALYAAFVGVRAAIINICKIFGIELKWVRKQREEHELLMTTAQGLKNLTEKEQLDIKKFTETQNKISESMEEISTKLIELQESTNQRFATNEEKSNKREQAKLKDKIGQSYRYYHNVKKINDIEMEALEGLIASYEDCGGTNSFVHSLVQKEMYTWEKVDREEEQRKGDFKRGRSFIAGENVLTVPR